jgi:enoyl-CoA hydratase
MSTEVLATFDDGVAVITMNRPESRNAVNVAVSRGVAAAIDEMERRPDIVVGILTGAGSTFCAGMDLKAFAKGETPRIPGRGVAGITEQPPTKPLIAAVEGWALAAGCELALAADMVVAGRGARFGLPEVKRGLVAAAGGLLRLPAALPYPVALRMALTGEPISAEEALAHGLVVEVTDDGDALQAAQRLAADIARNGPLAVRATKQIMAGRFARISPTDWAAMREISDPVFASSDAKEGAIAFAEKRTPIWQAR